MFYIDHDELDINMNTDIQVTDSEARSTYGGVFYINNVNEVVIIGNTYQNFESNTYGSFLYSTATNLELTIEDNTFNA